MDDNWYQITPENCPENYGFNAIPLSIPPTGQTVTIEFCGEADKNGFHTINADKAGWRYGIVTITKEGKAVYGEMKADPVGKSVMLCQRIHLRNVSGSSLWERQPNIG